jgi:hypothetical protein
VAVDPVCIGAVDQEYVYGRVPPEAETVTLPSIPELQLTDVADAAAVMSVGSTMVTLLFELQLLISVTVTVYVPVLNPVAVAVFCPLLQE